MNDRNLLTANADSDLSNYRRKHQEKYREQKQKENLANLNKYIQKIQQLDRTLENFKRNFYSIFTGRYVENVEELKTNLSNIRKNLETLIQKNIICNGSHIEALTKCETYLDNLLNNQSLLSKVCYDEYVVPLIDTFWNFKYDLEKLSANYGNNTDAYSINDNSNEDLLTRGGQPSGPSPFEDLPNEMLQKIKESLPSDQPAELSAFVLTSKRFYHLFQPQRLIDKFLQYVVYGNQEKAEAILKVNPELLLQKGKVTDYSGRIIEGTALQIALGAEDVKYHDDEECMAEMIQKYLKQLPDGEAIMSQQIAEQFPKGWEEQEAERAKRDSAALRQVIEAISNAQPGDDCEIPLQAFRNYLESKNKGKGVIKTGKHFNVLFLVEAFKLYDENYDRFGGRWNSPKNILCWRKVIGYIERFLPACYAQAFCQGVYYIVEDREKLNRSLKFRFDNASFFPLGADPGFILGRDYAGSGEHLMGLKWGYVEWSLVSLQTISSKKHQRREDLRSGPTIAARAVVS